MTDRHYILVEWKPSASGGSTFHAVCGDKIVRTLTTGTEDPQDRLASLPGAARTTLKLHRRTCEE